MNALGEVGEVLVIGSITADVTAFARRLPAPGETVLGNDLTLVLGGKGANQAVAAARFGMPTSMVGCVGDDVFADLALGGLRDHGVGTDGVRSVAGPTGVAHIRVSAEGQNDIVITPLANDQVSTDDVDRAIAARRGSDTVLLLQLEIPAQIATYAARAGHLAGMTVVLDPAPATTLPTESWSCVDVVTPNETEASEITGIPVTDIASAERAAGWFRDRGVAQVIVTLGDRGAVVLAGGTTRVYPPFPVSAVDSTAAGDAFTGTLGAALAGGRALDGAIEVAMAAAALAVTRPGASPSLPSRDEVNALLAQSTNASTVPPTVPSEGSPR